MTFNHRQQFFLLPLVFAALAWILSGQNCIAQDSLVPLKQTGERDIWSVSALIPDRAIKSTPKTLEIYQYDKSPLGSRQPLLLVHGLLGEFHPFFRWQELAQYLNSDQAFQNRYKIYLARYNSRLSLREITGQFKLALRHRAPAGGLTIIAISLSGKIIRHAMQDQAVDQSISKVLTLGAFFRGSPLFCSNWMQQSIRKRHLSPLIRLDRSLGYKLYFARHKNLLADYAWDNVDGQMPGGKLSQSKAALDLAANVPTHTQSSDENKHSSDHKFVVYAGYLHNQYIPRAHSAVYNFLLSPVTFASTTFPAQLGREHPALRYLDSFIAGAVPKTAGSNKIIYPLNDGISPISSSLLLTDDFVASHVLENEASIKEVVGHSTAKKARLFDNIDHLTFIEGHRPAGSAQNLTDLLAQTEQPHSMFAWILRDLLE